MCNFSCKKDSPQRQSDSYGDAGERPPHGAHEMAKIKTEGVFAPSVHSFIGCLSLFYGFKQNVRELYYALCHHRLGNLHEACDIGALDVVDIAVGLGSVLHAVLVNVLHDGVQTVVDLLGCP